MGRSASQVASVESDPRSGALAMWARERAGLAHTNTSEKAGLRFAFYGRVSTEDHQDPATSRAWQLLRAESLVSGHGRIVAEFFDVGHSRSLPWARRPEAAQLPAAMADPDRGFDAIVIGSSERAFHGNQFTVMAPLFEHYGVAVWIPELGGAADPAIARHEELMVLLGILAKREITRTRIRVRSAMTVQTRDQGRYLGGRPPYGYRLVDAGPHPNRAWLFAGCASDAWMPIRNAVRSSGGSSPSALPATAWPESPGPSTTRPSPAPRPPTATATCTAAATDGP
ncbi:recombinase family protein [Kitasatospora sp. GP82]|uniref:recombinase family protein n=1 Tax=Kitasatospora sp. GP82 TaxID=3035089 RepID=UPI00247444F9|nr:recombinase family protein [Kitasatospora sp. GP82]